MPYFRITVIKQNGSKHSGIRHFTDDLTHKQIERQVWQRATDTMGRLAIADIKVDVVPADHPDVVAYILQQHNFNN